MIRRAVQKDLAGVVRLEREVATAPHWGVGEYEGMVSKGGGGLRRVLFVGEEGGELVGFAVGKVVAGEGELESAVVRAEGRRRGLGSTLCRAVMEWVRAEGAEGITLEVRVGSAGAVRLYEGLGFVAVGRRAGYYSEPMEDALVMRCGLEGAKD